MNRAIVTKILAVSNKKKREAKKHKKKRYLYSKIINIPDEYYVGICGFRGIGKTVLLTQLANEYKDSVYLSADASYLRPFSLYEIIDVLRKEGFKNIFVDEIQHKMHWEQDIKTIYDEGEVRIFFTGSSKIEVSKGADLSRRVRIFEMLPATFGEYLTIKKGIDAPRIPFEKLLEKDARRKLAVENAHLNEYIDEYFRTGGVLYPGREEDVYLALRASVNRTISSDLATLREVDIKYQELSYKLLYLVATSKPFEMSYSSIANSLEISKNTVKLMTYYLERVGLIKTLLPCERGHSLVRKEPKIVLTIPLRSYLNWEIGYEADVGSLREDFFVMHMRPRCYLKGKRGEKTSDFIVENLVFEVGGKSKSRVQNPDFLVVDGVSTGDNSIPLYLVGLVNPLTLRAF